MTAPKPCPPHLVTSAVAAPCGACPSESLRPEPVHVILPAAGKPTFHCREHCPSCSPWNSPAPEAA